MESLTGQPTPEFPFDVQTVTTCMRVLRREDPRASTARHVKALLRDEGFLTGAMYEGAFRFCFVHRSRDFVVKTGRGVHSIEVARRAWDLVRTHWTDALRFMAPTWWLDGVEIQLYARPNERLFMARSTEVFSATHGYGIGDLHCFNIGWRDDKWYIIDFSSWEPRRYDQ